MSRLSLIIVFKTGKIILTTCYIARCFKLDHPTEIIYIAFGIQKIFSGGCVKFLEANTRNFIESYETASTQLLPYKMTILCFRLIVFCIERHSSFVEYNS